ncbi:MAG: serine protease [Roseiarcus sp.]|jgi:hypothetical protein
MIPLGAAPSEETREEAKRLVAAGLRKAEVELVALFAAPIFWVLRTDEGEFLKNGTTFFLDAGQGVFGVTAAHVVTECFHDCQSDAFVGCFVGGEGRVIEIKLNERIIDGNPDLDIATFRFSEDEVKQVGHSILTGYQKEWPPILPLRGRGVAYAGFPGKERRVLAPRQISFGVIAATGAATSVHEDGLSIQLERDMFVLAFGDSTPPENFNFGGMSGGPVITIVETNLIRSYMPAGVIFGGPNVSGKEGEAIAGFEVIRARPIHYIMPDGTLDNARWEMNNIQRDNAKHSR